MLHREGFGGVRTESGPDGRRRPEGSHTTTPLPMTVLLAQIRELNPSASASFLAEFEASDLAEYATRLQWGAGPRRSGAWVRRSGVPALEMREPE